MSIVTDGRFSIVGDLRLWNKDGLRSRAGGRQASPAWTTGASSSRPTPEPASASSTMSTVTSRSSSGTANVAASWQCGTDSRRSRSVYEPTSTGIRLATEAKQLIAASSRPPRPNDAAVAEYLIGSYRDHRHTFFDGVSRVAPAHYLLADRDRIAEHEYWTPAFEPTHLASPDAVADEFRERLIESVCRRANSETGAIAHLSGGLDSSSIAASAAIAAGRGALTSDFQTVSAVFPDEATDESRWIREIIGRQPFAHHDFVPAAETVEQFGAVMWQADGPVHNRIRGIWEGTAGIATSTGGGSRSHGLGRR